MRGRLWLVGGACLGLMAATMYLLREETVEYFGPMAVQDEQGTVIAGAEDPLIDTAFVPQDRVANLTAWGLSEAQSSEALKRIKVWQSEHRPRLLRALEEADDPDALRDHLCIDSGRRPRYWATAVLVVQDKNGRRRVLDPGRVAEFEIQEWSLSANIRGVYEKLELSPDRQSDATRMGIAAIMLGKEDLAVEGLRPWSTSLGGWSFNQVEKENKGTEDRVVAYFALAHLVLELAHEPDGFCEG